MRLSHVVPAVIVFSFSLLSPVREGYGQICQPDGRGTACLATVCPNDGDECRPRCARFDPETGAATISQCDCMDPSHCQVELVSTPTTPCVAPDNGNGTADVPPAGCTYTTPIDDMHIIDGLPAGTTIEIDASQTNFVCPGGNLVCSFPPGPGCTQPGGSLGGDKSCADATLQMPMLGTGALAGFNRNINIPIALEIHTAPRTNGAPSQSFETSLFRLFGQAAAGDPDFDLLRVTGGTDFGLPSPGHTTLTQVAGGHWAVDSFFDITYRIDFVGAPGGPLGGMSGSTTGTIRFSAGTPLPPCAGVCPPGTECQRDVTANPDGSVNVCCDCVPIPVCAPNPGGQGCQPTECPIPGQECKAKCTRYDPVTGQSIVTECDCIDVEECHAEQGGAGLGCTVPDNGSGTVDLPPAGCDYTTPDDDMAIIDGLPPGTTIQIDSTVDNSVCPAGGGGGAVCSFPQGGICSHPGGTLSGDKSCADATLTMPMNGTGTLAGFNPTKNVPISFEIHAAPRVNGQPTQSFDTDLFRLFGQITGDPDFDLLRVVGGTDFGLPSPGHTTLVQLPGGSWAVDSFFDVTYRIDFVGAPGGPLAGGSGSTTGTVRIRAGSAPTCVGVCPPGTQCRRVITTNPDGSLSICCECEPLVCEPNPGGDGCRPTECPIAGQQCLAKCSRYDPASGQTSVIQCECVDPEACHAERTTPGQACVVGDNGSGSADLMPAGCTYTTPDDDMAIIDGLPPATTIQIDATQGNFTCPGGGAVCSFPTTPGDCHDPGGTLGGEQACNDADLFMPMQGTGSLAGFNRNIIVPVSLEVHSAPKINGAPVQSFDTDMFRLFGQITGDPDFDLLRVVGGTDFGLPSPGHTTLTQLGGGNWAVDSFFDITYRIDFVGKPGSVLGGMSGSTTGTIRIRTGGSPPTCVGLCPPGIECKQTVTQNPDGTLDICCSCEPVACEPNPAGTDCKSTECPVEGDRCRPRCAKHNPTTGLFEVVACDCIDPESCHLELETGGGMGCVEPDNGGGGPDLPPVTCSYSTPNDDMRIVDGLPPATTVEIDATQGSFSCPSVGGVCSFPTSPGDCIDPGGSLGGEKVCADAVLTMPMAGTGALGGFNALKNVPISLEIHHAPRTPGAPVQSFDTDLFRLFGQITGDPDFDLLRVVGGTDFGLPSPGHTTLTQLPGGSWAVDSFFDITYRIDFVGKPGGALSGMSGSTTGTVRFAIGGAPTCTGMCPPGTTCVRTVTEGEDGSVTLCCECKSPPVITQWRSVRDHGTTPLSILLDPLASGDGLTGPTVETRAGGIQRIEIDFDQPVVLVNPGAVSVMGRTTSYPGGVMGGPIPYIPASVTMVSPTTLALTFLPGALPNGSCYAFDITGVVENAGGMALAGDPDCNVRALVSDTTMSGDITLSDAIWTKMQIGTAASTLPEHDLDVSGGIIDIADVLLAKGFVASPWRKALCP